MANSEQEIYRLNKKIKELLAFSEKSKFDLVGDFSFFQNVNLTIFSIRTKQSIGK